MFDAIVVGARAGGLPVAMLLARKGYRILAIEKGRLSIEPGNAQYIQPPGAARLKRWGVLDALVSTGCPPIRQIIADVGEFQLKAAHLPCEDVAESYCPRASVLDEILLKKALEAGVEVCENFQVSELLFAEDRVVGIRGQSPGQSMVTERARFIIGADGIYSVVARGVKASEYGQVEPLTCGFSSLWAGVPLEGREIFPRAGRFISAAPTHEGLTQITVHAPRHEFREWRVDLEANFLRTLERAPEFAERVRAGQRVAGFVGEADTTNYFRVPHGPGWALVGDAGAHQDSITAQGLTDAWRDAENLAEAVANGLSGAETFHDALAGYQRHRDATMLPMYQLTCNIARLLPPDARKQAILDALRDNPDETRRFFAALSGTLPVNDFFDAENIDRLLAATIRERPQAGAHTSTVVHSSLHFVF